MPIARVTIPLRPNKVRRLLACVGAGGVLAATGIGWGIGEARADAGYDYATHNAAAICLTLDKYPSFAGIEGVAQAIVNEGLLSFWDAGRAIRVSVDNVCPVHDGLLDAYSATYAPKSGGYVV